MWHAGDSREIYFLIPFVVELVKVAFNFKILGIKSMSLDKIIIYQPRSLGGYLQIKIKILSQTLL